MFVFRSNLWFGNRLWPKTGIDSINWRCLEEGRGLWEWLRVFTEEVGLQVNFEEWPGFHRQKEFVLDFFQSTGMHLISLNIGENVVTI